MLVAPILAHVSGLLFLAAAVFAFTDPTGDARGDGTYVLPTRPALSADAVDLREFQVVPGEQGLTFRVSLGAMQNPWNLPSGFSAGVTDIFLKNEMGGPTSLPGLNVRVTGGWKYHLRVSGAGTTLEEVQSDGQTVQPLQSPQVQVEGTTLVISTTLPEGEYGYWVTSSLYSPLAPGGLLRPGAQAGPTSLSSTRPNPPVPVDVLAPPDDFSVYSSGVLAPIGQTRDARPWILGGLGGAALFLSGLVTLRQRRVNAG